MTQFSIMEIEAAERIATTGENQALALGDCVVRGNDAEGYSLTKDGRFQGAFRLIRDAMLNANVMADCVTTIPVGRG